MRRYGYDENRVFRAVAILLVLRVLATPVLVGAILLVAGWLLLRPGLPPTDALIPPTLSTTTLRPIKT